MDEDTGSRKGGGGGSQGGVGVGAATKRTKFRRAGGSKNACSWSSSTGSGSAHQAALIASLLADLSSEVIFEDERQLHPGACNIPIRAASIRALVRLCIQSFETTTKKSGEVREELTSFPRTLLLMHRWFTSSPQLAFLLTSSWEEANLISPCNDPSCTHFALPANARTSSSESSSSSGSLNSGTHLHLPCCRTQKFKTQVVYALRYWIHHFPMHFSLDERLQESVAAFRSRLDCNEAALLDLSSLPNYDWMRNVSTKDAEGTRPSRKVSLVFNHLEPNELALHLTFLEHKIIRRITFEDLKNYAENPKLEDVPKLERSVSLFNGLSQWIQCVVLSRPTAGQRADVIVKFVHVAQNLRKLQNFNSLMGVVGSLSHSALARLTKTMECVPVEERKTLKELTALVSSTSNFSSYRKALAEAKGFKIPILGVHLKDLISLHTALPDYVEGGLINFRKMSQLFGIFAELDNLAQCHQLPAQANLDLLNTLRASLDLTYSEDEIYELSLSREPRTSVSPTRSPGGLGDSGNMSYEKQLQAMVEAVFRNYDSNQDGFISREEFQQICNNHPAIDSFFVLDENRDGLISKTELERYLRNKKNMSQRHNFHEQTYFKPTFCIHCSGLLWGLIRQGYKCRHCGVNAHKYCKEYMLHECKPTSFLHLAGVEPKRRGFRIRKKSSSQSESGSPPSPKLFSSLEQLSLSVESGDGPTSQSQSSLLVMGNQAHSDHSLKTHNMATTSSTTPKSPRRLSSVLSPLPRRPSTSVPSSPKLGGFSLPLWSPCKNLFHPNSSQTTSAQPTTMQIPPPPLSPGPSISPQNPSSTSSSPAASFVQRAGQGLGKLFGTSPSSSPQLSTKHQQGRNRLSSAETTPTHSQANQRQHISGGVH